MNRWQLVAEAFVEIADTIGDDFDVLDFLQTLVDRAAELTEAEAAALVLADPRGRLQLVAASEQPGLTRALVRVLDEPGPLLEAFSSAEPVGSEPGGGTDRRWPEWDATLRAEGFAGAHVVPMRIRTDVLGALSLFFAGDRSLDDDEVALVQALATVATIGLLQERTPRQRELIAEHLQTAFDVRVTVEQAKGVVAESLGVDVDRAFALIRERGRRQGRALSSVASDILEARIPPEQLADLGREDGDQA